MPCDSQAADLEAVIAEGRRLYQQYRDRPLYAKNGLAWDFWLRDHADDVFDRAADRERLAGELKAARETNRRLNSRCQAAESSLPVWRDILNRWKPMGGGFGRAFLAWGLSRAQEENASLRSRLAEAERRNAELAKRCVAAADLIEGMERDPGDAPPCPFAADRRAAFVGSLRSALSGPSAPGETMNH